MTAVALAGGVLLLASHRPVGTYRLRLPRPEAKDMFEAGVAAAVRAARWFTDTVHNGSLQRGLLVAILVMLAVGLTAFLGGTHGDGRPADAHAQCRRGDALAAGAGGQRRASSPGIGIACWRWS